MIFGLKAKTLRLVILFTVIETVVLAIWLALAMRGETLLSFIVLLVGLFFEHVLATIAGKAEGK